MLYPLTFKPILKSRVWGGRKLAELYRKPLPPDDPVGESWEIADRAEENSVIANGPLAGATLHDLMAERGPELLGFPAAAGSRFPLLVKILDAQEVLSLQVHPPPNAAARLGGQPKTEMWYVAHAEPGAELIVGLRAGVSREEFQRRIAEGTVAECCHRVRVQGGDAMFLPSGRLHAIGAGLVLFEIQQNSDTTYRVFDWNRVGLDGQPRPLHLAESLASIDFDDFEPDLIRSRYSRNPTMKLRYLVDDPHFRVDAWQVKRGQRYHLRLEAGQIVGLLRGRLRITYADHDLLLNPGEFALLPAALERVTLQAETAVEYVQAQPGNPAAGAEIAL